VKYPIKTLLLIAAATLCFAAAEPRVPRASLVTMEDAINTRFRANIPDPYDLLGTARGTYLEGYGVVFTLELELVTVTPPNPFKQTISDEEKAQIRDRKLVKLPQMKETMRGLMAMAGTTLPSLPANERVAMEAVLWTYSWENSRGMPKRVFMSAQKQKLLDAQASHTNLATIIEEQER
jgi:hypothetical protein